MDIADADLSALNRQEFVLHTYKLVGHLGVILASHTLTNSSYLISFHLPLYTRRRHSSDS